jgi:hypothetical protein
METERVHEVGKMDETGRGWVDVYSVPKLAPFEGASDETYTITRSKRVANVTNFERDLQFKALDFIAARNLGRI